MENEKNENKTFAEEVERELTNPEQTSIPETQPTETSGPKEEIKKPKKLLTVLIVITIFVIVSLTTLFIILAINNSNNNQPVETEPPVEEEIYEYSNYKLDDFKLSVEVPLELETKIFSESDGENIYVWGYTGDEAPDYIDETSEDFVPFFALNYSPEPFSNENYSFSSGDGAYTLEDGRVLYLHEIVFENTEIFEQITLKIENGEELSSEEQTVFDEYEQLYDEIRFFELVFKDGFNYSEL